MMLLKKTPHATTAELFAGAVLLLLALCSPSALLVVQAAQEEATIMVAPIVVNGTTAVSQSKQAYSAR